MNLIHRLAIFVGSLCKREKKSEILIAGCGLTGNGQMGFFFPYRIQCENRLARGNVIVSVTKLEFYDRL